MAPTLAYWKIRGLAQPIRLLLGYTGTEFNDVQYELGDAPDYSTECWTSVKDTLGLDFPNLPYFLDGDIKITQSNAIMRYIGRKHNLDGKTEAEKVRVDIMENQAMDFRNGFVRLCYNVSSFETLSPVYKENVAGLLKKFDGILGRGKFFAGDELTYVDFIMYELFDQHRLFDANLLKPFENIKAFMKRFEEIPQVAAFMKSEKFFKGPINNKQAYFK